MTLKLILMRHAKSAWDDPLASDIDRKLNARGRRSAQLIAKWLEEHDHIPDTVLASSAARTLETWERMAGHTPGTPHLISSPKLYLAGPDVILGALRDQSAPSILLICHNPGIAEFAARIVDGRPDHPEFRRYPTAATAVFTFDRENWSDVTWQQGQLEDFTVPRELD